MLWYRSDLCPNVCVDVWTITSHSLSCISVLAFSFHDFQSFEPFGLLLPSHYSNTSSADIELHILAWRASTTSTMAFPSNHDKRQARHEPTSQRVYRYSPVSASPIGQECLNFVGIEDSGTSERDVLHYHDARVCHEGICSMGIEREIMRHPDSMACFDAISLCLRLPMVLLQSISALRETGPWHDELESIYGPLFATPPTELFDMVLALRRFPQFEPARLIEQLQLRKRGASAARKPEAGRTAPDGQAYECPSENCKKQFKKSGHAQNHVDKHHPEYLKLHPDYQPSRFIVESLRSASGSPELQRAPERQSVQMGTQPAARPVPKDSTSPLSSLLDPIEQRSLLSPRSFGLSSMGEWEEEPQLSRSRSHSRPSPRQPVTPQGLETEVAGTDRHTAVKHLAPHFGSLQTKRGRHSYSSIESMAAEYIGGEPATTTTTGPQRRHSKRVSTHYPH